MANITEYSRLVIKRSTTTGVIPTIPISDEIDNTWIATDLLIGEVFINTFDDRMWMRTDNGIVEITTATGPSAADLSSVLATGNTTGASDISVDASQSIKSSVGGAQIDMNHSVGIDTIQMTNDNGASGRAYFFMGRGYTTSDVVELSNYDTSGPGGTIYSYAAQGTQLDAQINFGINAYTGKLDLQAGTTINLLSLTKMSTVGVTTAATILATDASGHIVDGSALLSVAGTGGMYNGNGTVPTTTAVAVTDTLNFDSNTLIIDATNTRVGLGIAPTVFFDVNGDTKLRGTLTYSTETITATGNITKSVNFVDTATTAKTVTLPTPVDGKEFIVKDKSGNANTYNITVATTGSETIDGGATKVMSTNYESLTFISDGTNWFII